jgi:uncharacterized 2Fe-2S/4Fe-4S cluster protein (DUF4445 family)
MARLILPEPSPPVQAESGGTVLSALLSAGWRMKAPCGGRGACGGCRVEVLRDGGWTQERACTLIVDGDLTLRIPSTSLEEEIAGLAADGPGIAADTVVDLAVDLPDPAGFRSGTERLLGALGPTAPGPLLPPSPEAIASLGAVMHRGEGRILCRLAAEGGGFRPLDLLPAGSPGPLGVAVDLGTTTIAIALLDLHTGRAIGRSLILNPQTVFGDDVISRIVAVGRSGIDALRAPVLDAIGESVSGLLGQAGAEASRIASAVLAGNPTMTHLVLGVDPDPIRRPPYQPVADAWPPLPLAAAGIPGHPAGSLHVVPAIAGWVGGDIVAGLLSSGLHRGEEVACLVDLGTNGEIALGNRNWLLAAACSAGPAFEGGGFRDGVRAIPGAIDTVAINPDGQVTWSTIGGGPPVGLCGSGLVDLVASLRLSGLIDGRGRFVRPSADPLLTQTPDGPAFVVVPSSATAHGHALTVTEPEIDNLLRAKAAVYAGIAHLAAQAGLSPREIDRFWVAGGLGSSLNVPRACQLGLLPDVPEEKIGYLGNASLAGALLVLSSRAARGEAAALARSVTYVDLGEGEGFHDQFIKALFIPHTDPSSFPNVWGILQAALAARPRIRPST